LGKQVTRKNLAVILLNWNGGEDTVECLETLNKSSISDFTIVVVDNGSTDNSLEKIREFTKGLNSDGNEEITEVITEFDREQIPSDVSAITNKNVDELQRFILIKNKENLGFAGGNNVGIRFALWADFESILLLNNDTTVEENCLELLLNFMEENKKYSLVTPMICYYDEPNIVWNCGGKLTWWGSRKYYYHKRNADECPSDHFQVNFITGCALMAKADIFRNYGLLSEKFFLGEEDYEFSLRMKKNGTAMAAVTHTRILHKVSQAKKSVFKDDALPNAFIHHLNRFINLKGHYAPLYWKVWRLFSIIYIIPMMYLRHGIPIRKLFKFSRLLLEYSSSRNSVTQEDYFQAKELFHIKQ